MRVWLIGFTLLLCCSCRSRSKVPSGILKPDDMQAVVWDMVRADVYSTDYIARDSSKDDTLENAKLQQQVFMIHQTTREAYQKSFDYYLQKPDLMKALLDTITARVGRRKSRVDTGSNSGGLKIDREQ